VLRLAAKYRADPALGFSPSILIRIAAAVPTLFPPGTRYQY
jgi:hypothetical protein